MAYSHLGVTEREFFGLQHGEDPVDSPVSAVPLWHAGLLHGLVSYLMFSYPTEMAGIKQTHQEAVKRWVWPSRFSWTLSVSVSQPVSPPLIISVPTTSGTWIPGGPGDVREPTSPCLTSECTEGLPDQPTRVPPNCEWKGRRWRQAAKGREPTFFL